MKLGEHPSHIPRRPPLYYPSIPFIEIQLRYSSVYSSVVTVQLLQFSCVQNSEVMSTDRPPPEIRNTDNDGCRYRGLDLDSEDDDPELEANDNELNTPTVDKIKELQQTVDEQSVMIAKLREELATRTECGKSETNENTIKKRKREEEADEVMNVALIADSHDKDIKIKRLQEEISALKHRLGKFEDQQPMSHVKDKVKEAKPARLLPAVTDSTFEELQVSIIDKINDVIGNQIESTVDKVLNAKLVKTKNYANVLSSETNKNKVDDFRSIMLATKNEERVEERDKAFREKNIIIHGVEESNAENDTTFVKTLFATVGCDEIKPKSTARIGVEHKDKRRPIKVSLNHENEALQVMNNLTKLKGSEAYKRISVTEDYTLSERKMIQEMRDQVKLKNQKLRSSSIDYVERQKTDYR